jgi:hypothetical protein
MSGAPREECLGELELDRLLAGDDDQELRRRVAACAHCTRRLAELEASRDAHMTQEHVAVQVEAIMARLGGAAPSTVPAPWWLRSRKWLVGGSALTLAAAATTFVLWPRRPAGVAAPDEIRDETRVKGGRASLEVVLVGPVTSRVVSDGEPLAAGATLSFRVACPDGCSVALFAVGDDGVSMLADQVPPPWTVAAGGPVQVPVSVTLDGASGDDHVVAFFCVRPPDIAALRAALEQGLGPGGPSPVVAGCEVRSHRVVRRGSQP